MIYCQEFKTVLLKNDINTTMKIRDIVETSEKTLSDSEKALSAIPTPDPKKQKIPKKILDKKQVEMLVKK